jgi:glycosidase
MLLLTLPGTIFVYNGDELGMKDATFDPNLNYSLPQALQSRAGPFSPMQWSDKPNAGFTSGKPWIPVADDYHVTNVETQTAHGSGMSHIKVFESLIALKKEPSFQWGKFVVGVEKSILFYIRQAEGFAGYLVAINFGPKAATANFKESFVSEMVPDEAEIVASTYNFDGTGRSKDYEDKTVIKLTSVIYLKPTEGIVLKWEPKVSFL